ncbi:MAG: transglycosylase family protein [Thermoleophilia bacterium]
MKRLISFAVALTVIPVGAQIAASQESGAPPGPSATELSASVTRLGLAARNHARRLGLRPPRPARPAEQIDALVAQERDLRSVVDFLAARRELRRPVDERPLPRTRAAGGGLASRVVAARARAARLSVRLGLTRPAPVVLASTEEGLREQMRRWRGIAAWLAGRTERLRPAERPIEQRIPHYEAFMCIARHESGARWDIATGNGYYGGLQMDRGFQQTYAPDLYRTKGTANNWTAEEQLLAAGRAVSTRGFTPWPNTARMCGLL